MAHFLPLVSGGRRGNFRVLAAVDNNVLRLHAPLQLSHLRMFATTSEESGRFNTEIADLLLVTVYRTHAVLFRDRLVLVFDFLQTQNRMK
jgi:hypothetical protein